jgi:deoxyribose-phosphate aldolase
MHGKEIFMDIEQMIQKVAQEVMREYNLAGGNKGLASYVDHTILKPGAKMTDVKKVCDEAKQHRFASVCVNPSYIEYVAKELEGSIVAPCCVIGFPLGATLSQVKAFETEECIKVGAKEVDMVINVGAARNGDWNLVKDDINAVVKASRGRALVKVIIETCLLTDEEKVKACVCAKLAGADFVKTSTGFSTGGATAVDVSLMRKSVGTEMGVKASGGVKTKADAENMIRNGATRLGTSSGIAIVNGDITTQTNDTKAY